MFFFFFVSEFTLTNFDGQHIAVDEPGYAFDEPTARILPGWLRSGSSYHQAAAAKSAHQRRELEHHKF